MNEPVGAAGIGLNEPEPFRCIEPFHRATGHAALFSNRRTNLAVEPQEVVLGQIETADGRFGSDTAMGPMPIVAMEPSGQFGCAFV